MSASETQLQESADPLGFPLPAVAVATDVTSTHWAFYFQDAGLPLSICGSWLGYVFGADIALQELQGGCLAFG